MKNLLAIFIGLVLLGCGNKIEYFSIQKALQTSMAQDVLDPAIINIFEPVKDELKQEEIIANRTAMQNKSASIEAACQRAFIASLRDLQNKTQKKGERKIGDIAGFYKKIISRDSEKFQCIVGSHKVRVVLRGDILK